MTEAQKPNQTTKGQNAAQTVDINEIIKSLDSQKPKETIKPHDPTGLTDKVRQRSATWPDYSAQSRTTAEPENTIELLSQPAPADTASQLGATWPKRPAEPPRPADAPAERATPELNSIIKLLKPAESDVAPEPLPRDIPIEAAQIIEKVESIEKTTKIEEIAAGGSPHLTTLDLQFELLRMEKRGRVKRGIWTAIGAIIVFAAVVVLVVNLLTPVFQMQRTSMEPTLVDGDVVVFFTAGRIVHGDLIAFWHGNHVLIKRVVAIGGDWVEILEDGTVYVNNISLEEPYVEEYGTNELTVDMPLQVTDRHFFVLGDKRTASLDSRDQQIGLIREDQVVGKALFRVWPLDRFGLID